MSTSDDSSELESTHFESDLTEGWVREPSRKKARLLGSAVDDALAAVLKKQVESIGDVRALNDLSHAQRVALMDGLTPLQIVAVAAGHGARVVRPRGGRKILAEARAVIVGSPLLQLPPELLAHILRFLPTYYHSSVRRVCRTLWQASRAVLLSRPPRTHARKWPLAKHLARGWYDAGDMTVWYLSPRGRIWKGTPRLVAIDDGWTQTFYIYFKTADLVTVARCSTRIGRLTSPLPGWPSGNIIPYCCVCRQGMAWGRKHRNHTLLGEVRDNMIVVFEYTPELEACIRDVFPHFIGGLEQ